MHNMHKHAVTPDVPIKIKQYLIKYDFTTVTVNLLLLLNYNVVVVVAFGLDDLDLDYKIIKYGMNLNMWREKPDHWHVFFCLTLLFG